ncbi:hypothetical protein PQQ73_30110 [Paraburkholderia strydomiana]|uniref:Peptide-binding protein n=1 Tax=Paraburkholderia strydomiana TaxID=1245417 RepID=A0ABW9EN94_9BURK
MDGLSRTKHWALGAVIAALCSFAYAKAPGMSHGGGVSGYSHAAADYTRRADAGNGERHQGVPAARPGRDSLADRSLSVPHGGANFAGGNYADGFGIYRPAMRRAGGPAGYSGDGRGRMQYAGAITPVSAESRGVPRPPQNAPVRGGSIRADVARYNEERGSARASQRQADDPRQSEGSPYRN